MQVLPVVEGHTNVLANHLHFIRLTQLRGPEGHRWAGKQPLTSHMQGINSSNWIKHLELEKTKRSFFAKTSVLPPTLRFYGSMYTVAGCKCITNHLCLGSYIQLGKKNGEIKMQRWNFPLKSCKMQSLTPKYLYKKATCNDSVLT